MFAYPVISDKRTWTLKADLQVDEISCCGSGFLNSLPWCILHDNLCTGLFFVLTESVNTTVHWIPRIHIQKLADCFYFLAFRWELHIQSIWLDLGLQLQLRLWLEDPIMNGESWFFAFSLLTALYHTGSFRLIPNMFYHIIKHLLAIIINENCVCYKWCIKDEDIILISWYTIGTMEFYGKIICLSLYQMTMECLV